MEFSSGQLKKIITEYPEFPVSNEYAELKIALERLTKDE